MAIVGGTKLATIAAQNEELFMALCFVCKTKLGNPFLLAECVELEDALWIQDTHKRVCHGIVIER